MVEVCEGKLVFTQFFGQLAGFFLVVLLLCLVYQAHNVAHAQDTVGHTRGAELVDAFEGFACTDEFYGLFDNGAD